MDFIEFIREMLGITEDFGITSIEKIEVPEKIIRINLHYLHSKFTVSGIPYKLYDNAQEREWQHLSWFDYKCYLVCKLPRYTDKSGNVKTVEPNFAPKGKSYTHLFASKIIDVLQKVKVQNTTASLLQTSAYIVRSVMEQAVNKAIDNRGLVSDLLNVSIDEKAYAKGHEYATILIDSDNDYVVDMHEGRKEKSVKTLFYNVTGKESQPDLQRVNMDMWQPYMNTVKELAPQALIVHDKFHLFKKLSEAIDKTRKREVIDNPLLLKQKYTVLKNTETRTDKQQIAFDEISQANLKTAQAWHIRENFKTLFWLFSANNVEISQLFERWVSNSKEKNLPSVNKVIKTFENHKEGIMNAFTTNTDSGSHENMNGRIQSVIAKARGFLNFDRFRINVLFYFGKLNFSSLNF
jgi:transposase